MKRKNAFFTLILALFLLCALSAAEANDTGRRLTILFTHDLHSHFSFFRVPEAGGGFSERGGYEKLETLIRENRQHYGAGALLVDGGDISMGTLFHTLYAKEATELKLLGRMGYDIVTFGNHDFDFHAGGLAAMLEKAVSGKDRLPEIVFSNAVFKPSPGADRLKQAFLHFPVKHYAVLERNGIRIGLFGLLGKDAASDMASSSEMSFADPVDTAKKTVDILKSKEKVDVIVCLSHSGTSPVKKYSEDEKLAREVPSIDVIISAHTHTVLPKPILSDKTIIVSAGCYGAYLGVLELVHSGGAGTKLVNYRLQPVSAADHVSNEAPRDRSMKELLNQYKRMVDRDYLSGYGYRFDQVLARTGFNLESLESLYARPGEAGLGNLITDAFRHAVEKAEGNHYEHIHLVLQPIGTIRDSILKGDVSVEDVFRVLSLGLGEDGRPGYPLIAYFITGRELKAVLEVHTSIAPFKPGATMQFSGVRFTFNPHRMPFERVTSVLVRDPDGIYRPLDPSRLYRICANIYTARRIDFIREVSHGLIEIRPKDRMGQPLQDLKKAIIYTKGEGDAPLEAKEWTALAGFLAGLPGKEDHGIPLIPDRYMGPEGRVTVVASWNPIDLISPGGPLTYTATVASILVLVLILFVLRRIIRAILKRRK